MDYTLDSYASFENEQTMLEMESRKKEDLEKLNKIEQRTIEFRIKCISGYFLRCSWQHKKQFILAMIKNINCFDTLLRIISYISTLFGKMAAYSDVSPHCKTASQQIFIDHDRSMEYDCLKETVCEDLEWLATTVPKPRQILMIMGLLHMAGGGLLKKVYIPIVNIYNKKVAEHAQSNPKRLKSQRDLDDIFDEPQPDDTDKYPPNHPHTIEVEKLRKKWDEAIDKYRREIFGIEKEVNKKLTKETKSKAIETEKPEKSKKGEKKPLKKEKKAGKAGADTVDWIQMLPIWIVKKILGQFDQKTLLNLKKVNHYWSYACDSLLKDRHAREFMDRAVEKMISNVDPDILKNCRERRGFFDNMPKKPDSPREKRLKKLMNRGCILEKMRPHVKKSSQTRTCVVSTLPKSAGICDPLDKFTVFPRLIKDDLLLYKRYPCILKDVNILIDVEESLRKQRDTLSYSMSQQLSDAFSMSEANLADW